MISTRKITLLIVVLAFLLPALFLSFQPARAGIVYEFGFDDLEDPWGYWHADNGVWDVGEPTSGPESPHSDPYCAATNLGGNYPRYTDSRLISPNIDLPDVGAGHEIVLRFWQWFSYYNEPHTTDDQGQVQVQFCEKDVWSEWEPLHLTVYHSSGAWSVGQCDLTAYAGKRVRIGFFHIDYYGYQGGESAGWYIDDVLIEKRWVCLFNQEETEGFESGWGCWWANNGVWEVGEPTVGPGSAHSGSYCVGTVLGANYPRYTDSRLTSPPIDLDDDCDTIYLRWWQWFSYYNEPHTTDDHGQVQIQTYEEDGWSDWQTLSEVYFTSDWSRGQEDLTAYAGKRVRIGFFHIDYYGYQGGESAGWYIDEFEIKCIDGPPPPGPDLTINKCKKFHSYRWGKEIEVILRVKNKGDEKADEFKVAFYLSSNREPQGEPIKEIPFENGLDVGDRENISVKYSSEKSLSGKYIVAMVDSDEQIDEKNEDNNTKAIKIP